MHPAETTARPDGGIGRRARLKIWFSQGSAGSIPVPGTLIIKELHSIVAPYFFLQILLALKIALSCKRDSFLMIWCRPDLARLAE